MDLWVHLAKPASLQRTQKAQHMASLGLLQGSFGGRNTMLEAIILKTNKQTKKPNIFLASLCLAYWLPLETIAVYSLQGLWAWGGFQAQTHHKLQQLTLEG